MSSYQAEIEKMKKPVTDEAFLVFVDKLEKILCDCEAVGLQAYLDHPTMIQLVEKKLPDLIKDKWLDFCANQNLLKGKKSKISFQN